MAILSFQLNTTGLAGVAPRVIYLQTNDTLATVLGAGYLNTFAKENLPLFNTDMALVSTKANAAATPQTAWLNVQNSSGVWSLVSTDTPGSVILPTTANYLAHYNGTTGIATSAAANVTNAGNISAGLSGTAGYFASFPATAATGSLHFTAASNAGNTVTTITNASQAAARAYTIPDGGQAASSFLLTDNATTQTIATGSLLLTLGNITASAGNINATLGSMTAGTTVTSGTGITATTGGVTAAAGNIVATTGNVTAGSSGHAGIITSFPATATTGSLQLVGVSNTGNTATIISNDAMGQASTVNIPDPANAVGQFLVGATATPFVSGNFPKNSGTAGLMVDSGITATSISSAITQIGTLFQVSVSLNTAAVTQAYTTPQTLITAVAGKVIVIHSATVYTASTGNTAYATGTAPIIQYGVTAHGAGTIAVGAGLVAGDITAASSQIRTLLQATSTTYTGITNTAVTFSNATANYTSGTGTNIVFNLVYELITATI